MLERKTTYLAEMYREPVESSCLRSVGCDSDSKVLELEFYWITVESGVGYALDAKSLAQGKKERDDRIVWRNLYKICDKYHQRKTARQIAIQDYSHDINRIRQEGNQKRKLKRNSQNPAIEEMALLFS
ncbi:hypothetical protein AKJ43_02475 [candidate division MSBL1 archaeon SCGC-AAA261D19]|uniref:Uncharacterized protein n=1 Tax=candidate division MSBL1 archaeon SCGC-AAA261D19 TaxID=1698273 RepID=A0A133V6M9_9EURY|nr:hypothetical protein AKJ43_02475 [candidate division MSBL1 archaeon SCGC-AAA261D19]